jgi:hypothetical protein
LRQRDYVTWIPVVISTALTSLAIAERFYSRFVSDVQTQKRHLKHVAKWLINSMTIIFFGIQVGCVIYLMRIPGPPTKFWILQIAISVGGIALYAASLFDLAIIRILEKSSLIDDHIINLQARFVDEIDRLSRASLANQSAIIFLASNSPETSPEVLEHLKTILTEPEVN